MKYYDQYREKLRTPDEAVKVVKSGDWVEYTTANGFPVLLDEALSRRRDELTDVKIRGNLIFGPIQVVECDPEREHFIYNSWHCSAYERKLCDKGLCNYIPMVFRNVVQYYKHFLEINVAMIAVTPMDDHGYFNLSGATGIAKGILDKADVVVLEVNENLPKIYGAIGDSIHISEADMVVEGKHGPLYQAALDEPTETDIKIAENIMPYISDSSTLQLGIGGLPGVIGRMIADSDLKDLGMHTELCSDAYYYIHEAGKLTNRYSSLNPGKGVLVIEKIDRMISINSCISTDLYGQVCAESSGTRQISGTGGQLDFLTGAAMSRDGKAVICMPSVFREKDGTLESNVKPVFNGDIVTSPRSQMYYLVTEYGAVNLVGRSTWERAEMIISIAHPDFRDELIKSAEKQNIWRRSNKR